MLPPLVADINVAVEVVAFLRRSGVDVLSAYEAGWALWPDARILREATARGRFVLSHDADFGRLAVAEGEPYLGILYLRPGDDPPDVVIRRLRPLLMAAVDWSPPVIAVFRRGRLRLRRP